VGPKLNWSGGIGDAAVFMLTIPWILAE